MMHVTIFDPAPDLIDSYEVGLVVIVLEWNIGDDGMWK